MRCAEPNPGPREAPAGLRRRACAGFTLAEVLAALLFMAIVIPVAVEGVRVASRAGVVGYRKAVAARLAERVLDELTVTAQGLGGPQTGVFREDNAEYRWQVRSENWNQAAMTAQLVAMQLLTVEVSFLVQGQPYQMTLSTLVTAGTMRL
jgi:type II secretory pathway pseudopilin PulG